MAGMNKISSTIVGAAGEYHVLSQLLRRGWIAALAPDGAPNMDILVTDENNQKLCAIQVKTRRDIGHDKGWHMKPKHESMIVDDLFYVFVDVGKQPSDPTTCYVLPSEVVADCIRLCHKVWLAPYQGSGSTPACRPWRLVLQRHFSVMTIVCVPTLERGACNAQHGACLLDRQMRSLHQPNDLKLLGG